MLPSAEENGQGQALALLPWHMSQTESENKSCKTAFQHILTIERRVWKGEKAGNVVCHICDNTDPKLCKIMTKIGLANHLRQAHKMDATATCVKTSQTRTRELVGHR